MWFRIKKGDDGLNKLFYFNERQWLKSISYVKWYYVRRNKLISPWSDPSFFWKFQTSMCADLISQTNPENKVTSLQ